MSRDNWLKAWLVGLFQWWLNHAGLVSLSVQYGDVIDKWINDGWLKDKHRGYTPSFCQILGIMNQPIITMNTHLPTHVPRDGVNKRTGRWFSCLYRWCYYCFFASFRGPNYLRRGLYHDRVVTARIQFMYICSRSKICRFMQILYGSAWKYWESQNPLVTQHFPHEHCDN